ncbi:DUF4235 domain-containing protein [Bailinhaonella thermotolerans]|uniref:DUF4235 domain-containing protein n=2 Tax=Bailinhaonella thermotolerans TaxID=1070861 RepID=A0A3A4AVX9_9ACTN|nr:DUF4235 domain-containing protein [Bailinhaonella thermotolerans]
MMRPVSMVSGMLSGMLAGLIFRQVWKLAAGQEDAPSPAQQEYGWRQILLAAAIEGAIFGVVRAAVDRSSMKGYERLTGHWPGD